MFKRVMIIGALALSVLVLLGCLVVEDSPAPGCVKRVGISPMGGCFGKTAIVNLEVEPKFECLSISANNCNGGILEVRNRCGEVLVFGGVRIGPQASRGLDVVAEGEGYVLVEAHGNFSDYVPEVDKRIEMIGLLGEEPLRVTFTKTAKLCE
jgi:hypothetical protein